MASLTGWSRGTWGEGPFGSALPVSVSGVSSTGSVGSVTLITSQNVPSTGIAGTGTVGSVSIIGDAPNISVTGSEATTAVGTADARIVAFAAVTGVAATGGVGSISAVTDQNISVTGVSATSGVGSITQTGTAVVNPTGVSATGEVNHVRFDISVFFEGWGRGTWGEEAWGEPFAFPAGTASVGTVSVTINVNIPTTGLEATSSVGSVGVQVNVQPDITGLAATGGVGDVTVTGIGNVYPTGVSADALTPFGGSAFTADGNAQLSTAQAKFGSASLLLDGTDDFVTSDENIDLSSGDFTVDMWIRPTSVTGYKGLWQSGTSSLLNVYLIGDQVQGTVAGSTTLFLSSTRISANVWTMISVEREGNVHRLYINGVLEQSSSTANRPDDGVFAIGKNGFGDFNGYIDELRLSSVARYGGTSFTEPTANYAVDGSTTALLHFDGTNGSTDIVNETEGGVTVEADANAPVTGLEATGQVNGVTATGGAIVSPTGVAATSAVGEVTQRTNSTINLTGLSATASVGSVTATGDAIVSIEGLSATTSVGQVIVWGNIVPNPGTTWSEETPSAGTTWTEIAA